MPIVTKYTHILLEAQSALYSVLHRVQQLVCLQPQDGNYQL